MRRRPTPTLLPYTTLFRSKRRHVAERNRKPRNARRPRSFAAARRKRTASWPHAPQPRNARRPNARNEKLPAPVSARSEEHTSELQSLTNLVCRLLLEKKNR